MRKHSDGDRGSSGWSYKYQRVRERLRQAVEKGEMSGKLPGERELSRRYDANPKTINKALTDLATEGLLIRHVGRGTFVAHDAAPEDSGRSLQQLTFGYLAPTDGLRACAEELYKRIGAVLGRMGHGLDQMIVPSEPTGELSGRRLSADRLRAFDGLALFGFRPAAALLASTNREHLPLVMVNNRHESVRTAAVLIDYAQGAFELTQYLIYLGHKDIRLCVDPALMPAAAAAETGYRAAMQRNALHPRATFGGEADFKASAALASLEGSRPTAMVCVGSEVAAAVVQAASGQTHPAISLCCIPEPCDAAAAQQQITTYEADPDQIARWVAELLTSASPARWQQLVIVPGSIVDRKSTAPLPSASLPTRGPDAALL